MGSGELLGVLASLSGAQRRTPCDVADLARGGAQALVLACLGTFDTGGYRLKGSSFMDSMKSDMGTTTLTGALAQAVSRGLNKRVGLILCCADSMVSGNTCKLGDIIRYRNGKSVEVMNTDAEGPAWMLADGLIDTSAAQPQLIIDCATLTGRRENCPGQ